MRILQVAVLSWLVRHTTETQMKWVIGIILKNHKVRCWCRLSVYH
jgi:hypothetical protein